ncbi:MAG: class I SAM-dependent methyltransferase [Verrucomicrobia bacterium]|nr:class I SAM-dependent methyltransferase [Verrucomicrobiota bacterium]
MSNAEPAKPSATPARLRLRVTAAAERNVRAGHPWVFSDSVREQNRDGTAGELAVIFDRDDRFFAVGLFDPDSPIRVRILHVGKPRTIDREWCRERLQQAIAKRAPLFGPDTTGYRLISGENDGWPGLVLDRYDTTLVLKLYTAAWLSRVPEIAPLIGESLKPERIVLRLSRNSQVAARASGLDDGLIAGSADLTRFEPAPASFPRVIFQENGLRFEADVVRGQKTGFFLDQRENRRRVGELAAGHEVLNAFSFSGGFALNAARGGAKSVTDLDISAHALDSARRNFALNADIPAVAACQHEGEQADVFKWLARWPSRQFGLIVLDPPSLAKRELEREGAITAYGKLVADALPWLREGGVLLAASCSAHVTAEEFFGAVRHAARSSGRTFAEMETTGHPPDHPATFTEANYLKGIYLRF